MQVHPSGDPKPRRPNGDRAALLALIGAVVVFWWPCLCGRMSPLLGDAQSQMRPWRGADAGLTKARWDALLWDGMAQYYPWRTFAGRSARDGLIPLWNPHQFCGTPFIANGQSAFFYPPNWLFIATDARYAFALTAALHYLLAGAFMMLLGRELGLSAAARLTGAVGFAFGGFIVSWTELPTLMNSAAWLPGVVWAIERTFRHRDPANALLIAVTLAMCVLAGHLQVAAYVWLVAGLHLAGRGVWALYTRQARIVPVAVGMFPLAIGVAAIQLLPTLELAKLSLRGSTRPDEVGFQFRKERALQPRMLPALVVPDALGTPEEWGRLSPAGVGYSETCGYVGKLTLLLALLGLAGIRRRRTLFFAGLAAIGLWTAMAGPTARVLYYYVPGLGQAGGFTRALCVYTFAVSMLAALGADRMMKWLGRERPGSNLLPRMAPWVGALGVAVIFVDLGVWGRRLVPVSPRSSVYPEREIVARLRQDAGTWRALPVTRRDAWTIHRLPDALLPPNSATAYGYDSVQGYDSLIPRVFGTYAGMVSPDGYTPPANGNMILIDTCSPADSGPASVKRTLLAENLGRASVKWLLVAEDQPPPGPGFAELSRSDGVVLYQNLRAVPRVSMEPIDGRLPRAAAISVLPTGDPARVACRLAYCPEGRLAVSDTAFPGWRALVDGRPEPVVLSPPMFRAVRIESGSQEVEMVYAPASFTLGMFASLLAGAGVVGWLVWCTGCRRTPRCVGRKRE